MTLDKLSVGKSAVIRTVAAPWAGKGLSGSTFWTWA